MSVYVYIGKLIKLFWSHRGRSHSHVCMTQSSMYILKTSGTFSVNSSLSRIYVKIISTKNFTLLGRIAFPTYYWIGRCSIYQLSLCHSSELQDQERDNACLREGVI